MPRLVLVLKPGADAGADADPVAGTEPVPDADADPDADSDPDPDPVPDPVPDPDPDPVPDPDPDPDPDPAANPPHRRTGCGPYFGRPGAVHARNTEPRVLPFTRRKRQRWHRLSGNGVITVAA